MAELSLPPEMVEAGPIEVVVKRFRCPHCRRTGSSKTRVREHMARCFLNPSVRSCKTCKFAQGEHWGFVDSCARLVDLSEPSCSTCGTTELDGGAYCPAHDGRVLIDMRVQCDKWEASSE